MSTRYATTLSGHPLENGAPATALLRMKDVDLRTGEILETSQIREIRVNPRIDPSIFEKL